MRLLELEVRAFRVLREVRLALGPGLNLIVGPNASGKTSVLEAVHVLARGRSFRTPSLEEAVRRGEPGFVVRGQVESVGGRRWVALGRHGGETEVRVGVQRGRSAAFLAGHLRVWAVHAGTVALVEGGPGERRQLVDWGVFHVEPGYLDLWRRYRRALRQYNALLRRGAREAELRPWGRTLAEAGEALEALRAGWLPSWERALAGALEALGPLPSVRVGYHRGWGRGLGLGEALAAAAAAERALGFCRTGPHAMDLRLTVEGRPARRMLSRGQQKLLALAMALAAARVAAEAGAAGVLLVDDLAAELDAERRARAAELLAATGAQAIATAVEMGAFPAGAWPDVRVFHVEQGAVAPGQRGTPMI